ncbi:hypothetical protein [Ferdinandcohnia sp. Marseille-Q9671]
MNKNKRVSSITTVLPTTVNNDKNSLSALGNFEYKPPNNTGVILGIIGGTLSTVGDALATIGAIIQLNIDVSDDFQSQVDDFKSVQEKDKMREEIDDLKEQVKQLEKIIKSNQQ